MKMQEARRVLEDLPAGFMVRFARVKDYILEHDHFPDAHSGETPIPTEAEAWGRGHPVCGQDAGALRGRVLDPAGRLQACPRVSRADDLEPLILDSTPLTVRKP